MTKWECLFFGVLAVCMIVFLDGCATATTIYHAHKDKVLR